MNSNLFEGLEKGDLGRLVVPELSIDEFKSKLGDDADVVVLSFMVASKEPANDLVSFVEKGYEWVLDADISSGEMEDGAYVLFVELERSKESAKNCIDLMEDLMNLTGQEFSDWTVQYNKSKKRHPLDLETLQRIIPPSRKAYERKFGSAEELDHLRSASGVQVKTTAPKNDFTESIRKAAGIN